MTPTEAADLIMRAGERPYWRFNHEITLDVILAAVATVMDAARADAFEEAAKVCEFLAKTLYDDAASINTALECRAAIRARAQSHREPKP